jgi:hypothetical protein
MNIRESIYIIALTFVVTCIAGYGIFRPMGRSEATAIIKERGSIHMTGDAVYIYLPQQPAVLEIEAAAVLAQAFEGVILKVE